MRASRRRRRGPASEAGEWRRAFSAMTPANSREHDPQDQANSWIELATTTPMATAVVDEATTLSYADLRYQVAALSLPPAHLQASIAIDRVALLLPNRAELVVALFACLWHRSNRTTGHARARLRRSGSACFRESRSVSDPDGRAAFGRAGGQRTECGGAAGKRWSWGPSLRVSELSAGEGSAQSRRSMEACRARRRRILAVLIYHFGHDRAARDGDGPWPAWRVRRPAAGRVVGAGARRPRGRAALTSLAHAFGLTGGLFSTVSAGATLLLPPLGHADGISRFLSRQRATFALGTPWVYASLVMLPSATTPLCSLHRCYSGGGALSKAVQHAFAARYGVRFARRAVHDGASGLLCGPRQRRKPARLHRPAQSRDRAAPRRGRSRRRSRPAGAGRSRC